MTKAKKPPTQVAGVEGIAPKPIELTPTKPVEQEQQVDWAKLCELPPFQMFAVECDPFLGAAFEYSQDDDGIVLWERSDRLNTWLHTYIPEDLYKQYCDWHAAKGYWPNETPMGAIKIWEV